MLRRLLAWLLLGLAAVALGLGAAWAERAFAIPKYVMQSALLVLLLGALAFAGWAAWGYYRAIRDEEDEE
ncbi:MAG: hypothetical protein JNK07_02680 [Alphaproteobacteria bacterium]|nr:hypothetical protein [Alphaproteobacteria bacterium]